MAVVLTTTDRLVPPHKQRVLADALNPAVFELDGDHDSCLVAADAYGSATRAAVDYVAHRAGLLGRDAKAADRRRAS